MTSVELLFRDADQAAAQGKTAEAIRLYEEILREAPENARALNALGNRLLSQGKAAEARKMFERSVKADPGAPPLWLNLAGAARATNDPQAELHALDQALKLDPYFVIALLQKAQCLERLGNGEGAARTYGALLACVPANAQLTPAMRSALDHGEQVVRESKEAKAAKVAAAVAGEPSASRRFDHCIDLYAGRARLYRSEPTGLYFPFLPEVPYFDRAFFPWFDELEAATGIIRDELIAVMREDSGFRPYVAIAPGLPVNQWSELNNSLDWSAFFLWENGEKVEANARRCPRTSELMERLPLLDIPGRAPTVMFSLLKPGAVIPPHTGVTNTRSVVHLALVVPGDCTFRVGHETREWQEGQAWAFDDTVEHEAWNRSGSMRAILIVDTWNPYLDEGEKALLRKAVSAMDSRIAT